MTRVPFGATCSPFLLAATLRHHLKAVEEKFPRTAKILSDNLYVDDFVTGADSVEEAERIIRESQTILEMGGMNLRKWRSNHPEIIASLAETESAQKTLPELGPTKILGVEWRPDTDDFVFEMPALIGFLASRQDTKRFLLQASARIFDPFGFLSAITITAKVMFQNLWERGTAWDEKLPSDLQETWDKWCQQLPQLRQISVPRILARKLRDARTKSELHIFCDASPKAYGAVAYIKAQNEEGEITIVLLMAKARVAPLKRLSLPRLELMGALIGARLASYLTEQLNVNDISVHCWTDSTVALSWIKSSALRWKPFVSNRVQEIQTLTDPTVWKHCPGKENPADLLTRGILPAELVGRKDWWTGPEWLKREERSIMVSDIQESQLCMAEERAVQILHTITQSTPEPLMNLEDHSSLTRVLRVTAWVRRFIHNCRSQSKLTGELTAEEVSAAEKIWQKACQLDTFGNDIHALRAARSLDQGSSVIALNPFLDADGIMRVGGRLQYSTEEENAKHPVILSPSHPFTRLLISWEHRRLLHAGVRDTLSQLRERYWIIRGRQAIKSVIRRCLPCQKQSCRAAEEPTAPLPPYRVTQADPFETTGIDFAGPIFYNDNGSEHKAYIALFTCATTRAVHLELVRDLSAKSFLMAFKRFVSRRGICKTVLSDNALTFKRASRDLYQMFHAIKGSEVQSFFSAHRISWKFIVERAAWWGGFWERMVRTVKATLRRVLGRSCLDYDSLSTVLAQAEAAVNSRPLTFVSSDAGELMPLTPAHFLIGRRLTSLPPFRETAEVKSTAETQTRLWRRRTGLVDSFWQRWRREYLLQLRSAHVIKPGSGRGIRKGDIVLLGDDRAPRQMWKMCRVSETFPGRDGRIRACRIILPNQRELRRPIQALYPLELNELPASVDNGGQE